MDNFSRLLVHNLITTNYYTGANGSGNGLNARHSSAGSALAGILEESHLRTSSLNEAELAQDLKEVRGSVGSVGSVSGGTSGGVGYGVGDTDMSSVGGDSGKSGKSGGATPKSEHSLVSSHPDNCVAIHPVAGEELVTMPTWGASGLPSRYV